MNRYLAQIPSKLGLCSALVSGALLMAHGTASQAADAVPAGKQPPLKIAFIYLGPVGDGGWTFAHDNGRKAVEKEFGDKVATSFVESVKEGPDAERVIRDVVG